MKQLLAKPGFIISIVILLIVIGIGIWLIRRSIRRRQMIQEWLNTSGGQQYPETILTLSESDLRRLADTIYSAKSWFNDDEEAVYAAMAALQTQADFNALAAKFQELYNRSLVDYLRSFLSPSEMALVNQILAANGIKPI